MSAVEEILDAIRVALEVDQGARFRALLLAATQDSIPPYRAPATGYLGGAFIGASAVGGDCARAIWYDFRWLTEKHFDARALRIFSRGVSEEPRFTALLRLIPGVTVWAYARPGVQFSVTKGPVKGKLDASARGLPGFGGALAPIEFKSHGASFSKLAKDGVRAAKPEHYTQMQFYLGAYGLPKALYFACEKETDTLFAEVIEFDREWFETLCDRADAIAMSQEPPPRLAHASPSYFKCKFCDHRDLCFGNAPEIVGLRGESCRACQWVRFGYENEAFVATCGATGEDLSHATQMIGCVNRRKLTVLR